MVLWESNGNGGIEPNAFVGLSIAIAVVAGVVVPVLAGVAAAAVWLCDHLTPRQGLACGIGVSWVWLTFLWLRYRYLNKVSRVRHEINRCL